MYIQNMYVYILILNCKFGLFVESQPMETKLKTKLLIHLNGKYAKNSYIGQEN
jgi:hypothetical protein